MKTKTYSRHTMIVNEHRLTPNNNINIQLQRMYAVAYIINVHDGRHRAYNSDSDGKPLNYKFSNSIPTVSNQNMR